MTRPRISVLAPAFTLALFFAALGLALRAPAEATPEGHPALAAIYDDILTKDAHNAAQSCHALEPLLTPDSTPEARTQAFIALAQGWGRVQAAYILGGYDMDAMDYPLLIDMFHHGKEDLPASLARAITSDSAPKTALFKNSYRSITALDDLMFSGPWTPRRAALSQVAAETVCARLDAIHQGYTAHRADFLADPDTALALLINAQIHNIYKTREWRIAEVVGLNKKTLGRVLPENAQYPNNLAASWAAIGAMLDTHAALLDADKQPNIATIAADAGNGGLEEVQTALTAAKSAYDGASVADYADTAKMIPLFAALQKVQKAFYDHLALSLGVAAGLVDADGD
ncbi:hypothetical protein [Rhodalgimonas zhirmunskyi]|uniref:Imelysin-like domain-containing protein n=1 Tax=Rhodalgimonas zhirmunskyi TaxID=2964767 RepID=A0AAJ1X5L3_9RHOB|nr:hypothetical protein [Rhodoalgimonas zhirmunskyi]MDQ2093714.1 hypothetical protein [Rhodoalgimonas zhirmunskyi]